MYKGTIIENSLEDKNILKNLKVTKTYQVDDWILDEVFVEEGQISDLSKNLAVGPWYVHLWVPGKDDVKVIYKDKIFDIKFSEKSTWIEAVSYGKSIGIPEEQLDFPID